MIMKKRGQFWYGDFMIAMLVIIVIGIIFANTIVDIPQRESNLDNMIDDGVNIANSLLSEGYDMPNWRNGNGRIGINTDSKIDVNKLDTFSSLVDTNRGYLISKFLFGTDYDYVFYFEDKDGNIVNERSYGGVARSEDLEIVSALNMFRMIRIVFLDNILILLFILPSLSASINCTDEYDSREEFQELSGNILIEYLDNPEGFNLDALEITQLTGFYEKYKDDWDNADCNEQGVSGKNVNEIILKYNGDITNSYIYPFLGLGIIALLIFFALYRQFTKKE